MESFQPLSVPALGGLGFLVLIVAWLVRLMVKNMTEDRGAGFTLADERHDDVLRLAERVRMLELDVGEQRTLKHMKTNELMRAELLLDTVRRLSKNCTCGSLDAVQELLDRRESP